MTFGGSIAILVVLLARLLLRRAPKVFSYALWSLALLRLLCPISFESAASPLPVAAAPIPLDIGYMQTPEIHTGLASFNAVINDSLPAATPWASMNPMQVWIAIGEAVWLVGMAVMAICALISLLRLRRRLVGAVQIEDGIYLADHIPTPFVFGVFRPRIYLPSGLSEAERAHVIAHERAHIRRLDHVTRLLGYIALLLHWFNPLVWLAFRLSQRDMELSCDELVVRRAAREAQGTERSDPRAAYAASLLHLSCPGYHLPGAPLAFGESDTSVRVKNILRYKQPALWLSALALLLCLAAAGCALMSRKPASDTPTPSAQAPGGEYGVSAILYDAPIYSFTYVSPEHAPQYRIDEDLTLHEGNGISGEGWTTLGTLEETTPDAAAFEALFLRYPTYDPNFSAAAIAAETAHTYQLKQGEGLPVALYLLVMVQKDGEQLLLYGYSGEDGSAPHARWLFALESQTTTRPG